MGRSLGQKWRDCIGKFWLDPIPLAGNDGFSGHELNRIRALIVENRKAILAAWDEHCGN